MEIITDVVFFIVYIQNIYNNNYNYKNNYNTDFIRQNIYRPTEADAMNRNPTPVTLPYIKGTSETISCILQPCNIRVAHKPTTTCTLQHLLTNVKDRDQDQDQMLRQPGFLYRWNWQKPEHKTDWTQASHKKWWCQQSHCCTSSTDKTLTGTLLNA